MPPQKPDDFKTAELLKSQEQHGKEISDLSGRIAELEGKLKSPQALAAFFQDATKDSRVLDGVFASMFCRFLKEHEDVQSELRHRLHEADRHYVLEKFKRWGGFIQSGILIAIGAIGKELIAWILAHLTTK
jgi:hypothetical protein